MFAFLVGLWDCFDHLVCKVFFAFGPSGSELQGTIALSFYFSVGKECAL